MRKPVWAGLALLAAGCVPVEDVALPRGMVRPEQRTVLLLYASPQIWVTVEEDTKIESTAKFIPGIGGAVQRAQDERDFKSSEEFKDLIPLWSLEAKFYPVLARELSRTPYPGVWVSSGPESQIPPDMLKRFNRASNGLVWRNRYYFAEPAEIMEHRDYSKILALDQDLVLEANVEARLARDEEGSYVPGLAVLCRLYRAGTMRLIWSREEYVFDKGSAKTQRDFALKPTALFLAYEALLPAAAEKIAKNLRAAAGGGLQAGATDQYRPPPLSGTP